MVIKQHPVTGYEYIRSHNVVDGETLKAIRHHHEYLDGSGYPDGLAGRAIPRLARIVAVCDAYDALVTDRPYRKARSVDDAIATLLDGAGKQWDPEVVNVMVGELSNLSTLGVA